jgi:hypothetical protein
MACQQCVTQLQASATLRFTNLTGIINTDSGSRTRSYLAWHGVLENNRVGGKWGGDAMFFAEILWTNHESMFLNAIFIE